MQRFLTEALLFIISLSSSSSDPSSHRNENRSLRTACTCCDCVRYGSIRRCSSIQKSICVCVCLREREREKVCVCVSMVECMNVRERETEREREILKSKNVPERKPSTLERRSTEVFLTTLTTTLLSFISFSTTILLSSSSFLFHHHFTTHLSLSLSLTQNLKSYLPKRTKETAETYFIKCVCVFIHKAHVCVCE